MIRRRYLTETQAIGFGGPTISWFTPTTAVSLDLITMDKLEWIIVPDDDPRVGTIEEITDES
jgi:hypothetical protein